MGDDSSRRDGAVAAVLFDVMKNVVETQRGVRADVRKKAGLTVHDVFFTETSRLSQVSCDAGCG